MFNYYFLVADTDLCLSVAKFPSYQSSRSFLVADTDLCLSVSKFPSYQSSRSFLVAELWEFWSILASNRDLFLFNSKFPSFQSFKFPKLQFHPRILPYLNAVVCAFIYRLSFSIGNQFSTDSLVSVGPISTILMAAPMNFQFWFNAEKINPLEQRQRLSDLVT